MILAFRALDNVKDSNTFDEVSEVGFNRGNAGTLYFRLVQQVTECDTPGEATRRYVPKAGSTVTVYFEHIDSDKCFNRGATQPFPSDDRSIWQVAIMPSDRWQPSAIAVILNENPPNGPPQRLLPISDISQENTGLNRFFI